MFNESIFNEGLWNEIGELVAPIATTHDPGVSFTISDELGGGGDDEE